MQSVIAVNSDTGGALGFVGSAVVAVIIIVLWLVLASSRFTQGGAVERPERVPQLYGYTVCLVALFWAIMSVLSIVDASLTLGAPLYRGDRGFPGMEPSVSSYEAFRTTYDMSRRFMSPDGRGAPADSIPDAVLRRRYDALRADRIEHNTVDAHRSLVTSILSLLVAAALFAWHWRWLRRVGAAPVFAGTTRIDI